MTVPGGGGGAESTPRRWLAKREGYERGFAQAFLFASDCPLVDVCVGQSVVDLDPFTLSGPLSRAVDTSFSCISFSPSFCLFMGSKAVSNSNQPTAFSQLFGNHVDKEVIRGMTKDRKARHRGTYICRCVCM